MKPILYYDDRSPPVRSCLMLIDRLQIDCHLRFVDLFKGEQNSPEFLKINPAHTVPTLVDGDLILRDSHTILIYLSGKYQNVDNCLYPSDRLDQLQIIDKLFFDSSLFFRRDSDFMSEIVKLKWQNVDLKTHKRKIFEVYSMLDAFLSKQRYIALDKMSIADFSIVTTLSTVNIIFDVTCEIWPKLHKWFQEMQQLPAFQNYNTPGLEKLKIALQQLGNLQFPIKNIY